MKYRFSPSALGCLIAVAVGGFGLAAYAAPKSSSPMKLDHMDYGRARKIILRNGWKPMGGPCEQVSESTCFHFPEIGVCTGVSPDFCGMTFVKENRCLSITTSGDEPDGDNPGASRVVDVTIRPGPCSKV